MPPPLLATKLYLPRLRPNCVRRPHLMERLSQVDATQVGFVSLPPGGENRILRQ